jgi:CheY-like chemotaxis protein
VSAPSGKTVKLLRTEDNPGGRELLAKGLEPFCEVTLANDGADELLKVIDEPPDVILCDYKMPGSNGRQVFEKRRGREATPQIPFLLMASHSDIEERLRPLVQGAEDFMAQPFLLKHLVRSAQKVVDRLLLEKPGKDRRRVRRECLNRDDNDAQHYRPADGSDAADGRSEPRYGGHGITTVIRSKFYAISKEQDGKKQKSKN